MGRLRNLAVAAILAGVLSGCDEGQPNSPAKPEDLGPAFAAKTADLVKRANAGMDLKAVKAASQSAAAAK